MHFSHQGSTPWIVAPYGTTIEACHPQTVLWYMGIRGTRVEFGGIRYPCCNNYNHPRHEGKRIRIIMECQDEFRIMFPILDEIVLWHFKLKLDIRSVNHNTFIFQAGHQVKLYQIVEIWQFTHTTRQNAILHVFSEDDDMIRATTSRNAVVLRDHCSIGLGERKKTSQKTRTCLTHPSPQYS